VRVKQLAEIPVIQAIAYEQKRAVIELKVGCVGVLGDVKQVIDVIVFREIGTALGLMTGSLDENYCAIEYLYFCE
jgi:hypothetical protein